MIRLSITPRFISERSRLTWREILFGIDNELLAPGGAITFASDEVTSQESPSSTLLELAGAGRHEPTRDLVEELAKAESEQDEDQIRDKWLYLVLAWIFEHKANYADPLKVVEDVYSDFGYPPRIACLVRYMPSDEPNLGSPELNERRMHEKWQRYLEEASAEYATWTASHQRNRRYVVVLEGWKVGMSTIDLMKLICECTELGLVKAKALVERVVGGERRTVTFDTAERAQHFVDGARGLGAIVRFGSDDDLEP